MAMTKAEKLQNKLVALQDELATVQERDERAEQVKKVRRDLGETLANGADKCGKCGHEVVGMLKRPGYFDQRDAVDVPPIYEIGCIFCPPYYITVDEGGVEGEFDGAKAQVKRRSYSARGTTIEAAVANWNAGKYVEDTKIGLNVTPDEAKRFVAAPEEAAPEG